MNLNQFKAHLSPDYFRQPPVWFFNSPDMYLYYYLLGGVVAGILLLSSGAMLLTSHHAASKPVPEKGVSQSAPVVSTPLTTASAETSAQPSIETSSLPRITTLEQIKSAEEQPSYELKYKAYQQLLDSKAFSGKTLEQIQSQYQKYKHLDDKTNQALQLAQNYMSREYFTAAIRESHKLVQAGPILGNVYIEAQSLYKKAHLKKIDYYLIQGQLSKAKAALKQAEAAEISAEDLKSYSEKIKNLELVGR